MTRGSQHSWHWLSLQQATASRNSRFPGRPDHRRRPRQRVECVGRDRLHLGRLLCNGLEDGIESRAERTSPSVARAWAMAACETVSFPGELCVALANYRGGGYRAAYTGGGQTSPEAQQTAIDRCNADRRTRARCQLRTVVCGDGR